MLVISRNVAVPEEEIQLRAIRSQGAGGQNVNKVATAIHLQFDIRASTLPDFYKNRLLKLSDQRISKEGVINIKAQQYRSQDKNREDALLRLADLIKRAGQVQKKRVPTRPSRAAKEKRIQEKSQRGKTKALRRKVRTDDA